MTEAHFPMAMVARRTGLSPHVIRVWERRYGAVAPQRTDSNRRLYSEADIERLALLGDLTRRGQPIGLLARMPLEQLQGMAAQLASEPATAGATNAEALVAESIAAVRALDARALESALARAETAFGLQGMLQRVIGPLATKIGELWRDGTLTAAHEHFASAVLRTTLGQAVRPYAGSEHAPVLVVATPLGHLHELGALIAGALASNLGWHVVYLGASLPAGEIAGAARQNRARLVGLSLVYPEDDPRLESELSRLRERLPSDIPIVTGGRAASAYAPTLRRLGIPVVDDLTSFGALLDSLRVPTPAPAADAAQPAS